MVSKTAPTLPLGFLDPCIFHVGYTALCQSLRAKVYTASCRMAPLPHKLLPLSYHIISAFSRLAPSFQMIHYDTIRESQGHEPITTSLLL